MELQSMLGQLNLTSRASFRILFFEKMRISQTLVLLVAAVFMAVLASGGSATPETQFHAAVMGNDTVKAKSLLRDHPGLNVNWKDSEGMTALHVASSNGYEGLVRLLLQHPQVDVGARANSGFTPVIFASQAPKVGALRALLEDSRVDINDACPLGTTALFLVSYHGKIEFVKWIVASGRRLDLEVKLMNLTPVAAARLKGSMDIVTLLTARVDSPVQTIQKVRTELGVAGMESIPLTPFTSTSTSIPPSVTSLSITGNFQPASFLPFCFSAESFLFNLVVFTLQTPHLTMEQFQELLNEGQVGSTPERAEL